MVMPVHQFRQGRRALACLGRPAELGAPDWDGTQELTTEKARSAERIAVIGVLAAGDCFDGYASLMARPALNWALLRATTASDRALRSRQPCLVPRGLGRRRPADAGVRWRV